MAGERHILQFSAALDPAALARGSDRTVPPGGVATGRDRMPSGWYILPFAAFGAVIWIAVIWAILGWLAS
ncbi:MAG: hypothetical protein LPK02_07790 [Rhodobacterales bacterium]|nr:hypothetical protein [Rhodobacterales bacterium]MDX5412933.1 hypothetical protein [Rhodobacterales bacterium]